MNEIEQALRAARRQFEPTASDRERVRRRLRTAAAGAGVATSLFAKGSAAALVSKFFFGGMLATLVGASVVSLATHQDPAEPPAPRRASTAALGRVAPTEDRTSPKATPSAVPSDRPFRPPAALTASAAPPAAAPTGAELEAELGLLRAARQASSNGDQQRARQLLDALDREHPESALMEERSALRAVTDCKRAASFLDLHPESVYAAKVRRACGVVQVPSSASFTDTDTSGHSGHP